ncbi:MAG TPA: hypothetical protein DCS07_09835 [Bdellovibrionales bacterium]|nr:MAG: hypothetical protein A2Z97_00390 [Bdellovibrionales bacterium GWB1_52_6]OFZ03228.1 MAG: hypothetical protein A2X97_09880 [Bdellovibrionales bacterium GWA1_52_35]OFZ38242.1 MAG: hypothetical protein A2070_05035 [Bdellovibrionales bacterium GWC1_52_8]HAR42912.1 hypothetical protein [Bdellovibrionales bacterium]HCM40591.1 hypothetical protein [Bdellovibrionales bacterium]
MAKPLVTLDKPLRLNLSQSIEMASQGTTSKTLIEDLGVKQILFSMDTEEEMSSHASSYPATVHVLEGKLQFQLESETFELGPNDFLMMPSGAKHALKALSPMRFLLTLFKGTK